MDKNPEKNHKILLFDGVCNLCNGAINFIIRHDKKDIFRFASLQSDCGKKLLEKYKIDSQKTDSIILIDKGKAFVKSTAALRAASQLNAAYPIIYGLIVVPKFIRDAVYNHIARHRYRWFGKRESCMVPTPEIKAKFLDTPLV